jgi:hypothetical protein
MSFTAEDLFGPTLGITFGRVEMGDATVQSVVDQLFVGVEAEGSEADIWDFDSGLAERDTATDPCRVGLLFVRCCSSTGARPEDETSADRAALQGSLAEQTTRRVQRFSDAISIVSDRDEIRSACPSSHRPEWGFGKPKIPTPAVGLGISLVTCLKKPVQLKR